MRLIKWVLYFFGALLLLMGLGGMSGPNVDSGSIAAGAVFLLLAAGLIFLGRSIEKAKREKERKERENGRKPFGSRPAAASFADFDPDPEEENHGYESAEFLHYPIGSYYGDLDDEDDERLSNIDPLERGRVIEKERMMWDLLMFDDDE